MELRVLSRTSYLHTIAVARALVGFAQSDYVANKIAQMRLRFGGGERFVTHEYRFDDLLSQMPAAFQYGAKTFAARPFRTISKHSRRVCRGCGASRSAIFR